MIVIVGLSHHTAPVEIREKLAVAASDLPTQLHRLCEAIHASEMVLLSTCNRVEWLAVPSAANKENGGDLVNRLLDHLENTVPGVRSHLFVHEGPQAIEHLFNVAASLDSLVVGEPQILGQLKDAFAVARNEKCVGPWLHRAFEHAFRVAKRVRTETDLGTGQVSIPTVAVDLAREIFGELAKRTVTLVGTGEMASLVATLLGKAGATVKVVGRTPEHTQALARKLGATAHVWDSLPALLQESDIVISSTSARDPVITLDHLSQTSRKRHGRSLFLVDLAVPRDVDPRVADLDGVYLYNVDDLSGVAKDALADRGRAAREAATIVAHEAEAYAQRTHAERIVPTIVALREHFRAVLDSELEKGLRALHPQPSVELQNTLHRVLAASVEKLLHNPTEHLRTWAKDSEFGDLHTDLLLCAVQSLFDLDKKLPD